MSYNLTSIWNLKNNTNELIYKIKTDYRLEKQTYGYYRGKMRERDTLEVWD